MNLANEITTAVEGPVQQEVHYDPKSRKIEVVHYFNLDEGKDVILSKIEKFVIGHDHKHLPLTEFSKTRPGTMKRQGLKYGTRFFYLIVKAKIEHPHARKFPMRGTSFPLSHLPHHIEVVVK
jgi:hypothetical protein